MSKILVFVLLAFACIADTDAPKKKKKVTLSLHEALIQSSEDMILKKTKNLSGFKDVEQRHEGIVEWSFEEFFPPNHIYRTTKPQSDPDERPRTTVLLSGSTYLHLAVARGFKAIVRRLVEIGANVNDYGATVEGPYDLFEATPLHLAAFKDDTEMVALLLELGAKSYAVTRNRYDAMIIAADQGNFEMVKHLYRAGFPLDPNEHTRLLQAMEPPYRHKNHPIHLACVHGYLNIIEYFLNHGVSANIQGSNGRGDTCIHVAAQHNNLPLIEFLVQRGGDVSVQAQDGQYAVDVADLIGYEDVVKWLLQHGSPPPQNQRLGLFLPHFQTRTNLLIREACPKLTECELCVMGRDIRPTYASEHCKWTDQNTCVPESLINNEIRAVDVCPPDPKVYESHDVCTTRTHCADCLATRETTPGRESPCVWVRNHIHVCESKIWAKVNNLEIVESCPTHVMKSKKCEEIKYCSMCVMSTELGTNEVCGWTLEGCQRLGVIQQRRLFAYACPANEHVPSEDTDAPSDDSTNTNTNTTKRDADHDEL